MAGFNIANFNLYNFAKRFWDMFGNPTPMDVEVPQKNPNGDIETYLCPNLAKFKKRVWDDVGGALGQFSRTFYVDAEGGDDSYEGSSSRPFKTIKKACDSVPVGGVGHIYLKTDNNIIDSNITLLHKTIFINGDGVPDSSTATIKNTCFADNVGNATTGFIMTNSYLEFIYLTLQTADYVDSSKGSSYQEGIILRYNSESKNKVILTNASVLIGDTTFIRLSNRQDINVQVYYYDYKHSVTDKSIDCVGSNANGCFIFNEDGTMVLNVGSCYLGTKQDGTTDLTWSDLVSGIVKDANGVPRNILSNIIF